MSKQQNFLKQKEKKYNYFSTRSQMASLDTHRTAKIAKINKRSSELETSPSESECMRVGENVLYHRYPTIWLFRIVGAG